LLLGFRECCVPTTLQQPLLLRICAHTGVLLRPVAALLVVLERSGIRCSAAQPVAAQRHMLHPGAATASCRGDVAPSAAAAA
jgi:hypothetical protein